MLRLGVGQRAQLAFAIMLALGGCAPPAPEHGVVRVAVGDTIATLNPVLAFTYEANAVSEAIFDGLVKIDSHGAVIADLATRVPSLENRDVSPDGRTIVYHLRHGVRWHDGAPFTSSDVAFTFALLRNPQINGANREPYNNVVSLTTPNDYTVVVRLRSPSAAALRDLFCVGNDGGIVPRHLLAHSHDVNSDDFGRHPVGTGPYTFVSWERGSRLVLQANAEYFAGAPHIKRLEILEVPDDQTLVTELQTQAVDIGSVDAGLLQVVRRNPNVRIVAAPSYGAAYLAFNLENPKLRERSVRLALALALDRARLAKVSSNGTAVAADSLIPPFGFGYDAANAPGYDPRRALQLMKDRAPTTINIIVADGPLSRTIALVVSEAWRPLGVRAAIRTVPSSVLYAKNGPLMKGTFDVAVLVQGFDADPDRSEFITTAARPPRGQNYARYGDADVDLWSQEGLRINDQAQRKLLYGKIQERLNRDIPYVPIAWISEIHAINKRIDGYEPETINSQFWNVAQWHD